MKDNKKIINSYKLFFGMISKDFAQFFFLVFLLILETVILISSVITALPLIEYIVDPTFENVSSISLYLEKILNYLNIEKSFGIFLIIFILLNIFKYFIATIISVAIINIKYSITYKLNDNLVNSIYKSKWKFFGDKNIGIILNSLTNIITKITTGISDIAIQLSLIFRIISYLTIPLFLNWKITLITIFFVGIFTLPIKILNKYAYYWGTKNNYYDNQLLKNISESYQGAKIIFGFNLNNFAISKIMISLKNTISFAKKNLVSQTIIANGFQPVALIGLSVSFFISFDELKNLPEIATIFYSLISAAPPLSSFLKGNISIINLEPALKQYNNILNDAKKLIDSNNHEKKLVTNFNSTIDFKDVSFSYNENETVLENVNFKIKKNDFVIFKGESGGGKSTLIDLILGLNVPTSGIIKFDGIDLNSIDLTSYRELIGYVPQDPFLFNGTIKDNILLNKNYNQDQIQEALNKSNCIDFVNKFSKKLETEVGDRGVNLSGGQRQRICLARALIKKPNILILDEPTSSLDDKSSQIIFEILKKLLNQMTIILISHNLDFVNHKDNIKTVIDKKVL